MRNRTGTPPKTPENRPKRGSRECLWRGFFVRGHRLPQRLQKPYIERAIHCFRQDFPGGAVWPGKQSQRIKRLTLRNVYNLFLKVLEGCGEQKFAVRQTSCTGRASAVLLKKFPTVLSYPRTPVPYAFHTSVKRRSARAAVSAAADRKAG